MRFFKFKARDGMDIWLDLDRIVAVDDDGNDQCSLFIDGADEVIFELGNAAADVVAAIQPPAAPDTYEEELAVQKRMNEYRSAALKRSRKNFIDRVIERGLGPVPPPTDAADHEAINLDVLPAAAIERLDELDRTARILLGAADAYWPRWAKDIIARRKAEITGITMSEV